MCLCSTDITCRTDRDDHAQYSPYSQYAPRETGGAAQFISSVLHSVTICPSLSNPYPGCLSRRGLVETS